MAIIEYGLGRMAHRRQRREMVATGTNIKPLEYLVFLRDVRCSLVLHPDERQRLPHIQPHRASRRTPDAPEKTEFILVDDLGVEESKKTGSGGLTL